MKTIQFIYNRETIDFTFNGNENVMVNATQMSKLFRTEVAFFMRNEGTEKFIKECLKTENLQYLNINSREDLIISKQRSGTWMHRILALKFAAWLDPSFELWVFRTMDTIILGHYRDIQEATIEKLKAEKEYNRKKEELIKNNPEVAEIFAEELKINSAKRKRIKAMQAATQQLKFNLFNQPKETE